MSKESALEQRKYLKIVNDEEALIKQINEDYKKALDATEEWRDEAKELYDLVAGDQWDELSRAKMEDELRPIVTFNIAVKYMDAVGGLEVGNRQEVRYMPREMGDAGVNELLTNAAHWVRDECDAEDEESEAFLDMILTGMGWTETHISTEANPEGDIMIERRDNLEMFWDTKSRKRNLSDARWVMRARPTDMEEIAEEWPDKVDDINPAAGDVRTEEVFADGLHDATNAWRYEPGNAHGSDAESKGNLTIIDYQWWTLETRYHVKTQQRGDEILPGRIWKRMQQFLDLNGVPYEVSPFKTRKYYRAIAAGGAIMEVDESPYQEGFTFKCMTGRRDRNANTWYALGRVLRDPQLWLNKFFSQILHTLNSNSKGGIMAQREAFENPNKAEQDWAKPDAITWLDKTSDEHGNPTVVPKPMVPYPEGMDRLMMFTVNSMPNMTGLNLEMLGLADRVQPGVLEHQRKQAGMTMIQWAFDSKKRYTKDQGRLLAYYIREYISDGRLIRVDSENGQQFVPLLRDDSTDDYDIIVDEAPTSPNNKERTWAMLAELMPALMQNGMPIPPEVLDYTPLPASLVQKWKEMIQPSEPDPMEQMAQELEMRGMQAEVEKTEAEADKTAAEAQKVGVDVGKTQAETQSEVTSIQEYLANAILKRAQAVKAQAETQKTKMETALMPHEVHADAAQKAANTGKIMGGG